MDNHHILRLIFFSTVLLQSISAADDCRPATCSPTGPLVRFPFRITGRQPSACGFPSFDLHCDEHNRTFIRLPSSRSYIVTQNQLRFSGDLRRSGFLPEKCYQQLQSNRYAVEFSNIRMYTFYNYSLQTFGFMRPAVPFGCLSDANHSVASSSSDVVVVVEMGLNEEEEGQNGHFTAT